MIPSTSYTYAIDILSTSYTYAIDHISFSTMYHLSAINIFNTNIQHLSREKRRSLLTLINGDTFNALSSWPNDI